MLESWADAGESSGYTSLLLAQITPGLHILKRISHVQMQQLGLLLKNSYSALQGS